MSHSLALLPDPLRRLLCGVGGAARGGVWCTPSGSTTTCRSRWSSRAARAARSERCRWQISWELPNGHMYKCHQRDLQLCSCWKNVQIRVIIFHLQPDHRSSGSTPPSRGCRRARATPPRPSPSSSRPSPCARARPGISSSRGPCPISCASSDTRTSTSSRCGAMFAMCGRDPEGHRGGLTDGGHGIATLRTALEYPTHPSAMSTYLAGCC
jgi:hypothetical protein